MRTVLITGAGGVVGQELIRRLLPASEYNIRALTSRKKMLEQRFPNADRLSCLAPDDPVPWETIDTVIHCAFAVGGATPDDLAKSLLYTRRMVSDTAQEGVPLFLNISTRSVYGTSNPCPCTEQTPVAPDTVYGMAKYASELLVESACMQASGKTRSVQIRLAALLGPEMDLRVVSKFVQKACRHETIPIIGGTQAFPFLDVRDAGSGLIALLKVPPHKLPPICNLGPHQNHSLLDLAHLVKDVAKEYLDQPVEIVIEPKDMPPPDAGMDSSLFYERAQWKPEYTMRQTIQSLFEMYTAQPNQP